MYDTCTRIIKNENSINGGENNSCYRLKKTNCMEFIDIVENPHLSLTSKIWSMKA